MEEEGGMLLLGRTWISVPAGIAAFPDPFFPPPTRYPVSSSKNLQYYSLDAARRPLRRPIE
jgi:hypothetical protein